MLKHWIGRKLDVAERQLGGSLDYARHILSTSLSDFLAFTKVLALAERKGVLPEPVRAVAGMVATRAEDCGTCLQIAIHHAFSVGVTREQLRAVLDERPEDLPQELALGYRFARAVVGHDPECDALRAELRRRWGDRAPFDLALVFTAARAFPTIKRTLGYATACNLAEVRLEGAPRA